MLLVFTQMATLDIRLDYQRNWEGNHMYVTGLFSQVAKNYGESIINS